MWVEIVFGVAGPLVSTTASWLRTRAAVRNQPDRLTAVMVQSFIRKLVFFGAYVVIALKVLELQPMPFMTAFAVSFIALLFAEAVSLSRLFATRP